MANLVEWITKAADGEPVEAVVIGVRGGWLDDPPAAAPPEQRCEVMLSWDEARPMLDYEFDDGYGGADCNAIWAWTPSRVIFVDVYDGATGIAWVPRHPQPGLPDMPGGG